MVIIGNGVFNVVSTHSRLKAAGVVGDLYGKAAGCFNTQPPEGGWDDLT